MNEKTVFPIKEDQLESLVGQAHGFVAAKLEEPFSAVEVKIVSQHELSLTLMKMIEEVRQLTETKDSSLKWIEEIFRSGEKRLASSFVNLLSKRILGLYTQSYTENTPGRLLLVGENIENVAKQLDLDKEKFFLWVLVHETMHVAQFNSQGSYFKEAIKEKLSQISKDKKINKEKIKEASTMMIWIEGSAEAMMDEPGLLTKEDIKEMRDKIEERRGRLSWSSILLQIITRKTSQYRQGRRFTQEVAKKYGLQPMALVISDPHWLPSEEEIRAPSLWIQRYEKLLANEK